MIFPAVLVTLCRECCSALVQLPNHTDRLLLSTVVDVSGASWLHCFPQVVKVKEIFLIPEGQFGLQPTVKYKQTINQKIQKDDMVLFKMAITTGMKGFLKQLVLILGITYLRPEGSDLKCSCRGWLGA